ncbi:MAG: prepilin-type N-terminal cleavage/methylation domain-containing protein [Kiritimatiellia bacterium]
MTSVSRKGFTLIELLVAVLILGVVIGVIGASVSGGIKVWEKAVEHHAVESKVIPGLGITAKDLAGVPDFYGVAFKGERSEFSLPVRLDGSEAEGVGRMGTVRYSFDFRRGALMRKTWPFPGAEPPPGRGEENLFDGAESVKFLYLEAPREDKSDGLVEGPDGAVWHEEWHNPTNPPSAVRIEVSFSGEGGRKTFSRTVVLRARGAVDSQKR